MKSLRRPLANNASHGRKIVVIVVVLSALLLGTVAVHWLRGFVKAVSPSPPDEFARWSQTHIGLRFVASAVVRLHEAGIEERSFSKLAFALTNDAVLSGVLTNGAFPDARNPFPGILPKGDYSRTLELPPSFNPTNVPLLWREMRFGEDKVLYVPWSGGDPVAVTAKDFQKLIAALIHQGLPTNVLRDAKNQIKAVW